MQVWFPQNWATVLDTTGQPALVSFASLLQQSPELLFAGTQASFPFFNTDGLVMAGSAVEMPGGGYIDYYYAAEFLTLNNSYSYGDYGYGYTDYSYNGAQMELLRLTAAKGPPAISLEGWAFIETLEYSPFVDDGATAYDAVDGFIPITSATYRLCSVPDSMQGSLQRYWDVYDYHYDMDFTQLDCFATSSTLDTNMAGNLSQVNVRGTTCSSLEVTNHPLDVLQSIQSGLCGLELFLVAHRRGT